MNADLAAPAPLISAGLLLARRGIYGMAWLDGGLEVTARFGDLVAALEVGVPLRSGLPILSDYEDDILALPRDGTSFFELPGILFVDREGKPSPRIDILVLRHNPLEDVAGLTPDGSAHPSTIEGSGDEDTQFLLLVTRNSSQAMDLAIARMQRDRTILLEQIAEQKKELERAHVELGVCNRDLEDFATIISHDLKAPMRALRYLADDIERALDDAEAGRAHEACNALKEQSRRMSTMLSGLLDYASLGRQKDALEEIDTRDLIDTIVTSFPLPQGFKIEIDGQWPAVETYVAPLDLVLRNLIENALNHHDRPAEGKIRVTASPGEHVLAITVCDDGPGIPADRQETVFLPFRSYRKESSGVAGTDGGTSQGMGLAFVKRTVEAVGGELTLVSDPDRRRGTEFRLSWPLNAAQLNPH